MFPLGAARGWFGGWEGSNWAEKAPGQMEADLLFFRSWVRKTPKLRVCWAAPELQNLPKNWETGEAPQPALGLSCRFGKFF